MTAHLVLRCVYGRCAFTFEVETEEPNLAQARHTAATSERWSTRVIDGKHHDLCARHTLLLATPPFGGPAQ